MILSRAETRRRLPPLTFLRWAFLGLLLLILAAVILVWYVRSADADYRQGEAEAIRQALGEGGLTEVEEAVWYTWDETMWIVRGTDKDKREWMIWLRKDGMVKEDLAAGYSEGDIRGRFASAYPSAELIRVLPGWFQGQPVWEIRYKKEPGAARQAVDFYSFKDGTLIKSYMLPG